MMISSIAGNAVWKKWMGENRFLIVLLASIERGASTEAVNRAWMSKSQFFIHLKSEQIVFGIKTSSLVVSLSIGGGSETRVQKRKANHIRQDTSGGKLQKGRIGGWKEKETKKNVTYRFSAFHSERWIWKELCFINHHLVWVLANSMYHWMKWIEERKASNMNMLWASNFSLQPYIFW